MTDLNLHLLPAKKPTAEQQELELNRTQVWIYCFNIDKSSTSFHGRQLRQSLPSSVQ
jgi:hypothetical protein